jgi:hypothetical protein
MDAQLIAQNGDVHIVELEQLFQFAMVPIKVTVPKQMK